MNKIEKQIEFHYNMASDLATKYIEEIARDILNNHRNLTEFCMGMGGWVFTDKNGKLIGESDAKSYMFKLRDFIIEWDDYLKITGEPMRFTANGPIIREW